MSGDISDLSSSTGMSNALSNITLSKKSPEQMMAGIEGKSKDELRNAAEEFESLFMNMVFQKMKEMIPESEVFGGSKVKFFESMLYDEYSKAGSKAQNIGLAEQIYKQLDRANTASEDLKAQPVSELQKGDKK